MLRFWAVAAEGIVQQAAAHFQHHPKLSRKVRSTNFVNDGIRPELVSVTYSLDAFSAASLSASERALRFCDMTFSFASLIGRLVAVPVAWSF